MNIAESLVESYIYADVFNREYQGGSDVPEKIYIGGAPVEYILPYLKKDNLEKSIKQDGGNTGLSMGGPLDNKIVPVGLVVIQTPKIVRSNDASDLYFEENREVVSESLYDLLIGAVLEKGSDAKKSRHLTPKRRLKQNKSIKQNSKYT
jgi:hypothetical protein